MTLPPSFLAPSMSLAFCANEEGATKKNNQPNNKVQILRMKRLRSGFAEFSLERCRTRQASCAGFPGQLFPESRLKKPSRSNSSRVLSSRYLFTFISILAPGRWESSSKVLRRPTWDTRVGKENFLAKYW